MILDFNSPDLVAFAAPLPPSSFPLVAAVLLVAAFLAASMFLIKQVGTNKYTRSAVQELQFALLASALFGFGTVLVFLASGINV
ncbi:hypothetical protein HK105_207768 [Polyrhizophydium stewartii]|uniref:Dolichyl-diphosphooligosaccharide-protein glycosyltransferase subunit OST5 n=1 Tax=Polyrhizophydium stewartii TaxID=2732419 RepID=A0ABR4MZS5_9FUNG|nr:hypothetical protein HK105_007051 [Polyrhizophydium stewartii]